VYGGDNPYLGSAVLHNANPRVTLEHYNRATSLTAAEGFRQLIRQYEKKINGTGQRQLRSAQSETPISSFRFASVNIDTSDRKHRETAALPHPALIVD